MARSNNVEHIAALDREELSNVARLPVWEAALLMIFLSAASWGLVFLLIRWFLGLL